MLMERMERIKWPRGRAPDTTDETQVADDDGLRFSRIGFGKERKKKEKKGGDAGEEYLRERNMQAAKKVL